MLWPIVSASSQAGAQTLAQLHRLEQRLSEFYASTSAYSAFQPGAEHEGAGWHGLIVPLLERFHTGPIRVLEIGAGRSGFSQALGKRRSEVEYHAQDITPTNRSYLETCADRVFIGPVDHITGDAAGRGYDLIFHTFVLEHVVFPERFLETIDRLLNPGGIHIVICPRYDFPGYVNPSLRHHSPLVRFAQNALLMAHRLCERLAPRPAFLINLEPALLHTPWYRDADAVHLVSGFEIDQWHRSRGYAVKRLEPIIRSFRDRLFKRLCLLARGYWKPETRPANGV